MTARRPMSEWKIVVRDRHPAYLDWESFERVEKMLSDEYKAASRYVCNFLQRSQDGALCQHLPADLIDAQVVAAFFAAVGPAELEAWTHAREARRQSEEALIRAEAQQIERLRYQAHLAERQYNRVDPDNRLIAGELERRWEMALRALRQAEEAIVRHRAAEGEMEDLSPEEQSAFLSLGPKLPELWQAPEMSRADKKALLRSLIDKVVLMRSVRDLITIRIVWRDGEVSELQVQTTVHARGALSRGADMEDRLLELARQGLDDETIAETLTREGYRSARRLYVPLRMVQIVRQTHRVLGQATSVRVPHTSGWLTISELATRTQISRYWINRSILGGAIKINRDIRAKRFLFPDATETIAGINALRAGKRKHLNIARRTIE